ncbi:MAG: hypothetical protein V1777_03210 [Candidatus Micrarchaeota archaeon]
MAPNLANPLWKGASKTKQQILEAIGSDAPLTAKQVFEQVRQKNNASISYQAVHKTLTALERELVLEKTSKGYQFNRAWLDKTEQWLKTAKERLTEKMDLEKPELKIFDTIVELGDFLIFDLYQYPKSSEVPTVCLWRNMYSLIGLSKQTMDEIRKTTKQKKYFVLCRGNTLVDKFLAKTFEKVGTRVKLGIPPDLQDCDLFAVGDHVCEVYFSPQHMKWWKEVWIKPKKVSELDLDGILSAMQKTNKNKAIIYHDPERAAKIRKQVEKCFKREK